MSRLTLAQQLKQLEDDDTPRTFDPETAYSSLDGLGIPTREGDEGREHYLDVGPSRLRAQREEASQTLLGDKYAGKSTGRMKIFDDDDDEEDMSEEGEGGEMDGDSQDDEGEEDDNEHEDAGDEDDDEEEDEEEDEDDGEEEDEGEEDEAKEEQPAAGPSKSTGRALDPVGSLRAARQKDIEKGKGIRAQKALFDNLITLRITFQKALTASSSVTYPFPADSAEPTEELEKQRLQALQSLADLNEKLLDLRTKLVLPGTEVPSLKKRKREENEQIDDGYWVDAAKDSFALVEAEHPQVAGILNKWSGKINAASLAVNSKSAGSSKFMQTTKGQMGILEAIDAGLANRREAGKTMTESEEAGYRLLLKEVIESRSGGTGGADLTHLRREKKKKREAERGGSKGRKLRYTVHEKAQNFMVPMPLSHGWHDEQIDELFSSLLGGAGMRGAGAETAVTAGGAINGEEGLASLGGLRVF